MTDLGLHLSIHTWLFENTYSTFGLGDKNELLIGALHCTLSMEIKLVLLKSFNNSIISEYGLSNIITRGFR